MKSYLSMLFLPLLFLVLHQPLPAQETTTATTVETPSVKTRPGAVKLTDAEIAALKAEATSEAARAAQPTQTLTAGTPEVPINYEDPKTFFDEGVVGAIETGIMVILGLLGGFIPGLRNVKNSYVRSGVVIAVSLIALATFKTGALTSEFFTFLSATFLPNFAAPNALYAAIKSILKFFNKKTPADSAPAT